MTAEYIQNLQRMHLAIWNEKDATRRRLMMEETYSTKIKMYDKDFVLSGIEEVSKFITKLLTEDPNFNFTAAKEMQATQNGIRFFWNIETSGPKLTGMDFFIIENEKVTGLYVFMD